MELESDQMNKNIKCGICPRSCSIAEGQTGFCSARSNQNGMIVCDNYGKVTSISLDPIEKKPLKRFMPGNNILSIGSYGCNFCCGFCQNNRISMSDGSDIPVMEMAPEDVVSKAVELKQNRNIGVAYTYNEPMVGYEFVRDCAKLVRNAGLKNVVVSNGYINEAPLREILPLIDAANIDLKAFNENFYKKIGGNLENVKRSIKLYAESCHLEITCLVIPDENDDSTEIEEMCRWIAGINRDIPLHLSRFFPAYEYADKTETSRGEVDRLHEIALKYLKYVYRGNY